MSEKLPPLPEKSYLGDDASYGYDNIDMQDYAREAIASHCAALAETLMPLIEAYAAAVCLPLAHDTSFEQVNAARAAIVAKLKGGAN